MNDKYYYERIYILCDKSLGANRNILRLNYVYPIVSPMSFGCYFVHLCCQKCKIFIQYTQNKKMNLV